MAEKSGVTAKGVLAGLGGVIAALILLAQAAVWLLLGMVFPFDGDGSNGPTAMQGPFPTLDALLEGEWRVVVSLWLSAAAGMAGFAAVASMFRPRAAAMLAWGAFVLTCIGLFAAPLMEIAVEGDIASSDGLGLIGGAIGLSALAAILLTIRGGAPVRPRGHRILIALAFVLIAALLGGMLAIEAAAPGGLSGNQAGHSFLTLGLVGGAIALALLGAAALIANWRAARWILLAAAAAIGAAFGFFAGGGLMLMPDMLAPLAGCVMGLIVGITFVFLAWQAQAERSGAGAALGLTLALAAAVPMGFGLFASLFPHLLSAERDARQDCGESFYTARGRTGEAVWAVSNYQGDARGCIAINASAVEYGPGVTPLPKRGSTVGLMLEFADNGAYFQGLEFNGPDATLSAPLTSAMDDRAAAGRYDEDDLQALPATRALQTGGRTLARLDAKLWPRGWDETDPSAARSWSLRGRHDGWRLSEAVARLDPREAAHESADDSEGADVRLVNRMLRGDTLETELLTADGDLIMRARFDLGDLRAAKDAFDIEVCGEPGCPFGDSALDEATEELGRQVEELERQIEELKESTEALGSGL